MEKHRFSDYMSAAAFAEAGEFDTAREMLGNEGGKKPRTAEKRKPYVRTAVFGAVSLAAYLFIFTRQDLVTGLFTMGGWHAVFPVGTALFFSFVHGAFASNLLNVMNLEARK
jgi:uncharacterized integral membrane protein